MTRTHRATRGLLIAAGLAAAPSAHADEGGASFWIPGQMGSFAAAPASPGLSIPVVYYHTSVSASGSRELLIGGNVVAGMSANADIMFAFPTYTFAPPFLGGQLSLGAGVGGGHMRVDAEAVLSGPAGGLVVGQRGDARWGIVDLYPSAQLKWHGDDHHGLVYVNGGIPIGTYDLGRLANLGLNHYSVDGGLGYTLLDHERGRELSIVGGVTYNFENHDTDYQNGIDSHVDIGVAQFVNKHLFIGAAGYAYVQITTDDAPGSFGAGAGSAFDSVRSRVFGVGPQAGVTFDFAGRMWTLAARANFEFAANDRPEGWNAFMTLVLPISPNR